MLVHLPRQGPFVRLTSEDIHTVTTYSVPPLVSVVVTACSAPGPAFLCASGGNGSVLPPTPACRATSTGTWASAALDRNSAASPIVVFINLRVVMASAALPCSRQGFSSEGGVCNLRTGTENKGSTRFPSLFTRCRQCRTGCGGTRRGGQPPLRLSESDSIVGPCIEPHDARLDLRFTVDFRYVKEVRSAVVLNGLE